MTDTHGILHVMIEIHLDAIASSINFAGGIILAIDALKARRRTKVRRGGMKLLEGLRKTDAGGQVQPADIPSRSGQVQSADGYVLDSNEAFEDWADRLTTKKARFGFILLAIGFGLDLFSKALCNPLFFSI